jgi:N6-L-threonylcarbamoyladenine synthase
MRPRHALSKPILCLGIESTAHTFGASIVSSEGKILSDIKETYIPQVGKGIHPREAAQHHSQVCAGVVQESFKVAKKEPREIDAIAVSLGPGLGPALRTGATVARGIAAMLNKPLIPVHHAIGHIEIATLTTGLRDPLVLLVSGGHTAIAACAKQKWRIFGETEDITIGNLFDMFSRAAKLPPPGGSSVEKFAQRGSTYVDLPYTVKGNDVSYSGLLTASIKKLGEHLPIEDICFSIQEVSFSMLTEATERSLAHTEKKELLLTGGVAANVRLQNMMRIIAEEHNARFNVVDPRYSGDCGAQIAWTGILAYQSGVQIEVEKSFVKPRWRLDEVEVPWRT